jgi:hypothetical protein
MQQLSISIALGLERRLRSLPASVKKRLVRQMAVAIRNVYEHQKEDGNADHVDKQWNSRPLSQP